MEFLYEVGGGAEEKAAATLADFVVG